MFSRITGVIDEVHRQQSVQILLFSIKNPIGGCGWCVVIITTHLHVYNNVLMSLTSIHSLFV